MTTHLLAGGISGILDLVDVHGIHHVFNFSEQGGRIIGECHRMLLGVMVGTQGERFARSNPLAMLRMLAEHSVPCRHKCDLFVVLCNIRPTLENLNNPPPEHIRVRQCAISLD